MNDDLSFLFSGKFLSHKQTSGIGPGTKDDVFINISSYGNGNLSTHMYTSFERNTNDKV